MSLEIGTIIYMPIVSVIVECIVLSTEIRLTKSTPPKLNRQNSSVKFLSLPIFWDLFSKQALQDHHAGLSKS